MRKNTNKSFIIPYVDLGNKFWESISASYENYIKEVYFPVTDNRIGSGRPKQPDKHLTEFLESGILPVSVLINPIVLARPVEEYCGRILKIIEYYLKNYNLVGITLSNLTLARIVKENFPDLKITASTLMEIQNEQQLVQLGDVFNSIVPSNKIIREINTLKTLRRNYTGNIRIMVNESCISHCIFRTQHFFEMSNPEITHPGSLCDELLKRQPWLRLTGGWILPQHLYLLDGLFDEIKLSGRISLQNPDHYIKVLDSYINCKPLLPHEIGGGPASVNVSIDIDAEFYKHTLYCNKNCTVCMVCADYWSLKTGRNE